MRIIFRNDCPLLQHATRHASPQSRYQLISNALTSHSSDTMRATWSKGVVISALNYTRIKKIERKREREQKRKGRLFVYLQPLFSFAIKRKLADEKRANWPSRAFSPTVNLHGQMYDFSRAWSFFCLGRNYFYLIFLIKGNINNFLKKIKTILICL